MRDYMSHFTVYDLDDVVADAAAEIRRSARKAGLKVLKSPDAIVQATAQYTSRVLVTRNTKDFKGVGVHLPYILSRDAKTGKNTVQVRPPLPENAAASSPANNPAPHKSP